MSNQLVAKSEMLIRKPAAEVFEALVNPEITSRFWFTRGSARLEAGKSVKWEWAQFGVQASIEVVEVQPGRLIRFNWPADEMDTFRRTVNISFESRSEKSTFVRVKETGFNADDENLIQTIAGQTEGWALVLSALKAWLEHGINLNVISDHKPLD